MIQITRITMALALVLTLGCGSDSGDGNDDQQPRGFTACGDFPDGEPKTCQPGQHCFDEKLSVCEMGCLSDINCLEGNICELPYIDQPGQCTQTEAPDAGPQQTDQLQRCLDTCTRLTSCGAIDAGEGAQCNSECQTLLSDAQRKAFADCALDWDCGGNIPACLNLECGPSYPCASGDCVGHVCL